MHQLKNLLQDLKLYGMIEALDSICDQVSKEAISFPEALMLIVQQEIQFRQGKKSTALQKKASFRNNSCLENWDHSFDRGLSRQQLRELSSLAFYEKPIKHNVVIVGQTGVGKTQLAIALGRSACHKNISVSFMSTNHFFEAYSVAQSTGKTLQWIKSISKIPILILDDFALRRYTHMEATILLEILEERFQKGIIIFTSQIDPSGWNVLFEDPAIVDAILDRIHNPSIKFVLSGKSYRTQLGQNQRHTIEQGGVKK